MMDALVRKVNKWADEEKVLQPRTMLITGVSGGADSVCLLHVLGQLKKSRSFSITAVHINHMLRGEEAHGDESFVTELCNAWGIPVKVFRENVKALSITKGLSFEETGRLVRYNCFEQVLSETGAKHIAVAHHALDQAETIFMNLL